MDSRAKEGMRSGIIGIICNLILSAAKLCVGLLSGMVSVVADAINNISDAASSIISLIGFRLSLRPADEEHPFGHARYEYIAALVVAFLVMLAGSELFISGIEKIIEPTEPSFSTALFLILIFSILVKLFMAIYNYRAGKKIKSDTLIATAIDSRNDVIATSAILIAAVISLKTGLMLDGYMTVAVALFILWSGFSLVRDTISPLLGTAPDPEVVADIEKTILSYEGVLGTHDLMVHDYGPGRRFASVHVEVPAEKNVLECHELIDSIEQDFLTKKNFHLVIHYDPIVTSDEAVNDIRSHLSRCVKLLYEKLSIHDLRIVPGEENTNVIFDCVVPYDCPLSEESIKRELGNRLKEQFPNHTAVIKIDRSFVDMH